MAAARSYVPPSPNRSSAMTAEQGASTYSNSYGSRYASNSNQWKPQRKEQVETAMELIPADEEESDSRCSSPIRPPSAGSGHPPSAGSSRPGSGNARRAPPITRPDSGGRRTPSTPTKQVNLLAVPRKPDRSREEAEKINWAEHRSLEEQIQRRSMTSDNPLCSGVDELLLENNRSEEEGQEVEVVDLETSDGSTEESSGEDEAPEEQDVEIKAPNELLMEFITCLQAEDYENGKKLCSMILMYEPDNPEALKFQSLIEEKIHLEAEMGGGSDSDSDEDSSQDDSEDSDGSAESGDESSSEESSSDEDDDDDEPEAVKQRSLKAALEIP